MTLNPIADKLARTIAELTIDAEADPETIFEALRLTFTFWMSCVCDDCRQNVAHKLMAEIPVMLEGAKRIAAASEGSLIPPCH
jgi:hypothetical protein